jgi:hypothetical protein
MTNEWNVVYANRQIRVVKTQSDGARLYVDGELTTYPQVKARRRW